ncbi:sensor histidine kinase [Mariniflexile ostreae]|uniref:Sensor histidine kinase n=1 Tax=Mariniflexile ostreae TaxID=1520892 RepID=A0ABV5FFG2_9FLAO
MKGFKVRKNTIHHILFWLIYFGLNTFRWGRYFDDYAYSFNSNVVEFSIHIILVYFNLYFLLPRLIPNKYLIYIFTLLTVVLAMTFVRIIFTYEFITTDVFKEAERPGISVFDFNYVLAAYIGQLYVIGFTTAIKITIDYVKNLQKTKDLENQSLENELSMLKSQLQPHFFFNTLNNLYSLTLEKSNKAPETVIKLSELMSYVIYQGSKKEVPLHDEIKYIQNYIDLVLLRFGNRVNVLFSITGVMENHYISPLLLLPFIENSFKHGTDCNLDKLSLYVDIQIFKNKLIFKTRNKKTNNYIDSNAKGIGLKNTKRRLGLLFGDDYNLIINNTPHNYTVTLKIPLNGNNKMSHY